MKIILALLLAVVFMSIAYGRAEAVVILPPLVAIAAVKVAMMAVGLMSVPAVVVSTLGTWMSKPKTRGEWLVKIVGLSVVILAAVGIVVYLVVKFSNG